MNFDTDKIDFRLNRLRIPLGMLEVGGGGTEQRKREDRDQRSAVSGQRAKSMGPQLNPSSKGWQGQHLTG